MDVLCRADLCQIGHCDKSIGPLTVDIIETLTIIGIGKMYRLAEWSLADVSGGSPGWANQMVTFKLLAGRRYTNLKIEFDFKRGLSPDKSKDWVDPFVGGVTQMDLTNKLSVRVENDIDGFGVGPDFSPHPVSLLGQKAEPVGSDGLSQLAIGYNT